MSIIYFLLVMLFAACVARVAFDTWDSFVASMKRKITRKGKIKPRGATPAPSPARVNCVPDFRNINPGFHNPTDFSVYDSPAYQRRNVVIH